MTPGRWEAIRYMPDRFRIAKEGAETGERDIAADMTEADARGVCAMYNVVVARDHANGEEVERMRLVDIATELQARADLAGKHGDPERQSKLALAAKLLLDVASAGPEVALSAETTVDRIRSDADEIARKP